jgi:dolichyl-phosphate beta-glucosyltransferase
MPDLALVVPVFNEETRLPATLDRLAAFAGEQALALEIVVADDGSRDRTADACRDWVAAHQADALTVRLVQITHRGKGIFVPTVTVQHLPPNRRDSTRTSARVRTPFSRCSRPSGAARTLRWRRAGFRIGPRDSSTLVSRIRRPIVQQSLRWLARIPFKDTQCGLKLFRAEAARQLFRLQQLDGFAFDIELVLIAMKLNLRIEEVPIRWAHAAGSKVSLARDSLRMARDARRVWRRVRSGALAAGVPSQEAMHMMTGSDDRHWWHVAKRRVVAGQLEMSVPPRRCLDIGCGGGAMLAEAARLGAVVVRTCRSSRSNTRGHAGSGRWSCARPQPWRSRRSRFPPCSRWT